MQDRFQSVKTVEEGIEALAQDSYLAFVYIALVQSPCLDAFIDLARRDLSSQRFSGALSYEQADEFKQQPAHLIPLTIQETSTYREVFCLQANPDFKVLTKEGEQIPVVPQVDEWKIGMRAVQIDAQQAQNAEGHQDNSALTVNFYACGRGIKYGLRQADSNSLKWMSMKSPVITVHRGTAHPLGAEHAVYHTGQMQRAEERRVNIFYTLSPEASVNRMIKQAALHV